MPQNPTPRIPKVIHYCWFGPDPIPAEVENCLHSWKKAMPDYQIIQWNTQNFDVTQCAYTRQAFAAGKYAFVADYARLYILYQYGGIYLDSDVEVLKSLEPFMTDEAFTGFESRELIAAWIMASVKGQPMFKYFLDYYQDRTFVGENGQYDMTPNTMIITAICQKHGLILNNSEQSIQKLHIYPVTYFCPRRPYENKENFSEKTCTIHYFSGSWMSERQKKLRQNPLWKLIHRLASVSLKLLGGQKHHQLKDFLESRWINSYRSKKNR